MARASNKGSRSRATASKGRKGRRGARVALKPLISLRPEHQRDLFALTLITVAAVTIIFFVTGVAGGVGALYVEAVRGAFGNGAIVVPVILGLLGLAILIQEQFRDAKLTGATFAGIG